jgi:Fe-S oxidoreductase
MENLKDYLYTLGSCNHCGQCKWILGTKVRGWKYAEICPIHERFSYDAYSGQGILNIALELLQDRLKYEPGLIDLVYSCTTCGACDVNCKSIRDMEVLDAILALRAKIVEDGQGPLEVHKRTAENIEKEHNAFGRPHSERFNWLNGNNPSSQKARAAYFVGCSSAYQHPEIARNTIQILNAGGIEFQLLGPNEYCCGASLWRTGQVKEAQKLIEHNIEVFRNKGIQTIITSCAECYGTFKGTYPRFKEMDMEVLHITEVAQRLLREGRLKLNKVRDIEVTYHDPCLLGRQSEKFIPWKGQIKSFGLHDPPKIWRRGTYGVYEAPREVLKAIPGVKLVEMARNEENSYCCGAGGGIALAFPDLGDWTANQRLEEARATGAKALVSCCPHCQTNFEKTLRANRDSLRYYDLTELISRALG